MGVHTCTSALGGPQRPVGKQDQCQQVIQVGQDPHAQGCSSALPCPALLWGVYLHLYLSAQHRPCLNQDCNIL